MNHMKSSIYFTSVYEVKFVILDVRYCVIIVIEYDMLFLIRFDINQCEKDFWGTVVPSRAAFLTYNFLITGFWYFVLILHTGHPN